MALKSKHEFSRLKQELLKSGCHGDWLGDCGVCWQRQIWPSQATIHTANATAAALTHSFLRQINPFVFCETSPNTAPVDMQGKFPD